MSVTDTLKTCSLCRLGKPLSDFGKCKSRIDGLRHVCRACRNGQERIWRKENPEKVRSYHRKYASSPGGKATIAKSKKKRREQNPEKARSLERKYDASPARKAQKALRYKTESPEVRAARIERRKKRCEQNPEMTRRLRLKYKYGVSLEEFDAMFAAQAGLCAICKKHMEAPHIDHDHATARVRALLCKKCNTGLGMFDESMSLLFAASEYLRYWKIRYEN